MQWRKTIQTGLLLVAVGALALPARGDDAPPAYELCLEQSPAQAGTLVPDSGTHRFAADEVVVLSAEPQPGYQFAYWLGDVADPKSRRTTVHVNSSKVVVAVFQPAPRERPEEFLLAGGGSGGGGGAVPTRIDLGTPGYSLAGGAARSKPEIVAVPVPVPVPEPATILLFGAGLLVLRRTHPGTRREAPSTKSQTNSKPEIPMIETRSPSAATQTAIAERNERRRKKRERSPTVS